jgi:DNA-binding IclR family transcriptional regulator
MLTDGRWHMLEDVQQQVKIDSAQLERITDFLKEYEFIEKDETEKKIKLNKMAQRFLAQTTTA